MSTQAHTDELVEVFHTQTFVLADKIVRVILNPEGVEATVLDRNDQKFPGAGQPGGYFVAVNAEKRERALGLIEEARENGMITED